MNILVINAGSSSIKFQVLQMPSEQVICNGILERIGSIDAVLTYKTPSSEITETGTITTHKDGFHKIVNLLLHKDKGVIERIEDINAVGHRVVHGGKLFSNTTIITAEVKSKIKEFSSLAPLHNPNNLEGILIAEELFPSAKQIAVFDTAFYKSLPEKAKKYAIPNKFYKEDNIQVYGFHGTSHKYVSEKAIEYLGLKESKIISIHLGNGCSMTAVRNGKSVDHSLGFAPSNGLIMGSRSGDIDHAIIFYLINHLGYDLQEIQRILNKESGMLGLTGYTDLRDVQQAAENGNKDCILALEMNAYRIKKYIGAYVAAMNGLDAVVFTAGIGENSSVLRKKVCTEMQYFGMDLDNVKNEQRSNGIREINTAVSKVKILVIPTNEELEIAKQTFKLLPI
ncbi:acetate kinase [uncultured Nonlabens sp.]|uniref:acetate/propionate family kinase n=1 Tax=uncultured Nonlabens sp. TaxID=859306 RepID=UPI0030D76167|tara:strand:- start:14274 stop:15461 length:1188 start_codon:yes stop_codon:yes gene_type:complete